MFFAIRSNIIQNMVRYCQKNPIGCLPRPYRMHELCSAKHVNAPISILWLQYSLQIIILSTQKHTHGMELCLTGRSSHCCPPLLDNVAPLHQAYWFRVRLQLSLLQRTRMLHKTTNKIHVADLTELESDVVRCQGMLNQLLE